MLQSSEDCDSFTGAKTGASSDEVVEWTGTRTEDRPQVTPGPSPIVAPGPQQVDVMLVLDRSGSIGGNLGTLQSAANAFVDAMQLDGAHMGMVSFSTDVTTDVHVNNNVSSTLHTAINALVSAGSTYLEGGINSFSPPECLIDILPERFQ